MRDPASYTWPSSHNPTKAWEQLRVKQKCNKAETPFEDDPQPPNTLRLVCISDTHNQTDKLDIPRGDVLVHTGDFSNLGKESEIVHFNEFLKKQPHAYKVVIAGNHDLTFDLANFASLAPRFYGGHTFPAEPIKAKLDACTYLEDSGCVIDGVRFWGSPWQPTFCDFAFNLERGAPIAAKWAKIPDSVDVLLTHGPPIGHGDFCQNGQNAGCVDLLHTIQTRVHPKVHVFGHVHEGYGATTDGHTTFVNASTCTYSYRPKNLAIIVDVPKPAGFTPGLVPM